MIPSNSYLPKNALSLVNALEDCVAQGYIPCSAKELIKFKNDTPSGPNSEEAKIWDELWKNWYST